MNERKNGNLTGFSKALRRNMTKEEKRLWYDFLKNFHQTINRQKVIGKYIVDFYCASADLVIELDGSQHGTDEGALRDAERDAYLNSLGILVWRVWNTDVNTNFNGVCEGLEEVINARTTAKAERNGRTYTKEG